MDGFLSAAKTGVGSFPADQWASALRRFSQAHEGLSFDVSCRSQCLQGILDILSESTDCYMYYGMTSEADQTEVVCQLACSARAAAE